MKSKLTGKLPSDLPSAHNLDSGYLAKLPGSDTVVLMPRPESETPEVGIVVHPGNYKDEKYELGQQIDFSNETPWELPELLRLPTATVITLSN